MEQRRALRLLLILTPQQAQQRRFTAAVAPDDGDAIAAFHAQMFEAEQHRRIRRRAHRPVRQRQQAIGIQRFSLQPQPPRAAGGQGGLFFLQPIDALLHLLGLARQIFVVVDLAPGRQAFGAFFHPVYLFLLGVAPLFVRGVLFRQRGARRRAGQTEELQRFVAQDPGAVSHLIEQVAIVRHQHEAAGPAAQELFQPQQRGQVQVVAGFVEQQQIGLADQRARQQQPRMLAAAEGAGGQRPARRFKPQLGQ